MRMYTAPRGKRSHLTFLGRIAPVKGTHIAIEVAKRAGIPLKIAGEIQPMFRDYYETRVKPHVDGNFIEYVGEADLAAKNELLGNSLALLFPIEWEEPFGLVMIEAMACGAPVLAFANGSAPEIVRDGVSGYSAIRWSRWRNARSCARSSMPAKCDRTCSPTFPCRKWWLSMRNSTLSCWIRTWMHLMP